MGIRAGGLSVEESSAYIGVGRTTLYGLIKGGDIKVVKIGRRTIVPRSELDAFIQRRLGHGREPQGTLLAATASTALTDPQAGSPDAI